MEREDFYRALCTTDNALMHHGILKQKWGHRNGPPYPLNKSDYSSAEKKALRTQKKLERKEAKAEKTQEKADRLKEASQKTREELEKEISTMKLMNDYNRTLNESLRLSQEYAGLTKKGDNAIKKALKSAVTESLTTVSKNALTTVGNNLINKAITNTFGEDAVKVNNNGGNGKKKKKKNNNNNNGNNGNNGNS